MLDNEGGVGYQLPIDYHGQDPWVEKSIRVDRPW